MDELKESERVLKTRVVAKCNENFTKIRSDFDEISNVSKHNNNPSIGEVIRRKPVSKQRELITVILDSLEKLEEYEKNKSKEEGKSDSGEGENSRILELVRRRKVKVSKEPVYTCTVERSDGEKFSFAEYEDGYYNLEHEERESGRKEMYNANESSNPLVENYWKTNKSASKEDLSVLKDFKEEGVSGERDLKGEKEEEEVKVYDFNMANLLGREVSPPQQFNYFEDYYNFNNRRKTSVNLEIQKKLRQVFVDPKKDQRRHFGTLVRGNNNDLIMKKDNAGEVVEYLVVFEEEAMEAFPIESFEGQTTTQRHLQKSCISKFFAHEVVRHNLRNKVLLKLKRFETTKTFTAKDMKNNSDQINKYIASVTMGCLWSDWTFYSGGILPELSNELITRNASDYLDKLADTDVVLFTKGFLDRLNLRGRRLDSFERIFDTVSEIITMYRQLVMEQFNEEYLVITKKSFLDLKIKPVTSELTLSTPEGSSVSTSTQDEELSQIDSELQEQREQILPKFNKNANTPEEVTDVRSLVSFLTTDLNCEPFTSILNIAKINGVSKTVLMASKNIKTKGKNKNLEEMEVVLMALKVLDVLVFLLQKITKSFNGYKELESFIAKSKYEIGSQFASNLFQLFYEKSNDTYSIKVLGSKRLMCYVIWMCVFLSPKFTFDFSSLLNFDLNGVSHNILFTSCVELTSLEVAGRTNRNLYRLKTPLTVGTKKLNLSNLLSNKNKRFKSR